MKKKIQILLIFLIVIIGLGILSTNQVFAEEDYSISIGTISYASQPNVLTRNVPPTPDVVANHENVQVEKSCYVGEAFSLTAIIVPSNAYVGEVIWTIEQDAEWHSTNATDALAQRQRAACYGNGYYIMAGLNGEIGYSKDGVNWTKIPSFTNGVITGLAYGNGCFMAIDYSGYVYKSTDPTGEWKLVYTTPKNIESVRFNNNLFMVVGVGGFVATSTDGSSWTVMDNFTTRTLIDSTYGNSYYIVVGDNGGVFRSTNLTDWEDCSISDFGAIRTATFDGENFVIGGINGHIATSKDGKNWTYSTTSSTSAVSYIRGFACVSNKIYAVLYNTDTTGEIWVSYDRGISWQVVQKVDYRLFAVAAGNNTLISGGDSGQVVIANHNSSKDVAKIVSQNGLTATIVGVHAGTCKIVCTAADGQGAYTTCKLTVYQKATEIILNPNELILEPGDTQQLIATILPEDTSDKTLLWESSNEEVVTVDEDGVVMAIAPSADPVKITVTMMDGSNVSATATIYVRVMVETLEWEKFSSVIYKNGNNTETFAVKVHPDHATVPTLKYSTSDPSVATVLADSTNNKHVIITPKKPGTFILTVETTDGSNLKLSAEVEVVQLVEHISLNTTEKILFLEDGKVITHQLIATALPTNATILGSTNQSKFIWTSSDSNIATVDKNGLVTAVSPGTAIITCKANDVGTASATCKIHVRKAVTSLEIDLYTFEYIDQSATSGVNLLEKLKYLNGVAFMYSGNEVALNAKFNDDATITTLMWQIPGIAKDANNSNIIGVFAKLSNAYTNPTILTALPINTDNTQGYLSITINCKATDGSGVTAQRIVQIRQPATSVEFSKTDMTLYAPDSGVAPTSEKIIPTILPANAYVNNNPDAFTDGTIVWVSSDTSVATVNEHGLVTAVGPGEATIIGTVADGQGAMNVCKVTVIQPVKSISMYAYYDTNKVELLDAGDDSHAQKVFAYTNQSIRLYADTLPTNATNNKLTWSSSDPEIARVENGFLIIGSKATAAVDAQGFLSADSNFVLIRAATTDGSGIEFRVKLYVLDAGYKVEMEEFVSLHTGDYDKLLLKVFKTKTEGDKLITTPIYINTTVKIDGDVIGEGDDAITVMKLFDVNGNQIKNGHSLTNVTNPSFDIQGLGNGLAIITFDVKLNEIDANLTDKVIIGNSLSFERSCTVKVTGTENRHISMDADSMTMIVGESKQVTTIVTPSNAVNFFIKYSLKPANDDYPNPYKYARIDETTGVIQAVGVGQVIVVATLCDTDSGQPIKYDDDVEDCEMPVYITSALTGVEVKDSVVYVGETLNLLDCTTILPEVLNDTLKASGSRSSVVKYEVIAGNECILWNDTYGVITGQNTGSVKIKAIATYHGRTYESDVAVIEVRHRLTGIDLTDSMTLKLNQVIHLTPSKTPLQGDTNHVEITWTSANPSLVTVEPLWTNNGFTGVVTAKGETGRNGVNVTVTIKVDENSAPLTATCKVCVIGVDVDQFSAEGQSTKFELSKTYTQFYRWGAYRMKQVNGADAGTYYAAGCMENGAFSLTTPYLYNQGETTVYSHYNTKNNSYSYHYYPYIYPLRTWMALERVEEIMHYVAHSGKWIYDKNGDGTIDATEENEGFIEFMKELNLAINIGVATQTQISGDRSDVNAYLDLPPRSDHQDVWKCHFMSKSGNTYSKKNFSHWGYNGMPILILTGLASNWTPVEGGAVTAEWMIKNNICNFRLTNITSQKVSNSYFSSALTALNVVSGSGDIALKQANALSIVLTYFPLDEERSMHGGYDAREYQLYHTTRQMLSWAVSGIQVSGSYARQLEAKDPNYIADVPHYTGSNMKYAIFMTQADGDANANNISENYVKYPYGYSKFYQACSSIVASGRFYSVSDMMVLVEGFVWKNDQVKHDTIPSFAHRESQPAIDSPLMLKWDSSVNAYTKRVVDENGVLNYYHFEWDIPGTDKDVEFINNGDGTLTIRVPQEAKDYIETHENLVPKCYPDFMPEDNKYQCAAFVKWEMETEICQVPYTDGEGKLRYAYILGQNAQSQIIAPKMIKSDLGDPLYAFIALDFEEGHNESEYETKVTSNVQLLDWNLNPVEYVIPGEQYVLEYTYTYEGDSRGLFFNASHGGTSVTSNIYGFAAELRARTNTSETLKELTNSGLAGQEYSKSTLSTHTSADMYELWIDKTNVNISGSFDTYTTPYSPDLNGVAPVQSWNSGTAWNDSLYISALENETVYINNGSRGPEITIQGMKSSSKHSSNITDIHWKDGKVYITWKFYTGHITLTTPFIKADADISIETDTNHIVTTQYNDSDNADKYLYGLTLNGKQSVDGANGKSNVSITNAATYINNYDFTGLAGNIVALYRADDDVSAHELPRALFDGTAYLETRVDAEGNKSVLPFSDMSLSDLQTKGVGATSIDFGMAAWFHRGADLAGYAVNIGSHKHNNGSSVGPFFVWWDATDGTFAAGTWDNLMNAMSGCTVKYADYAGFVPVYDDDEADFGNVDADTDGEGVIGAASTATPRENDTIATSFNRKDYWDPATVKANLHKFTLTNHMYYGGLGYFEPTDENGNKLPILDPIVTKNATNSSWFHTDKTWQTTFDLTIENLVVNTGAGITSPTLIDTRSFVNLNIYYTVDLQNDAYKMIVNRYGQVGSAWRQYYKEPGSDSNELEYYYKKQNFYYVDGGVKKWCSANETPRKGVKYYFVNVDLLPEVIVESVSGGQLTYKVKGSSVSRTTALTNCYYIDNDAKVWCASGMSTADVKKLNGLRVVTNDVIYVDEPLTSNLAADFIPNCNENLIIEGTTALTMRPTGYAEEKPMTETLHTDVFVDFTIFDNSLIQNQSLKLDPATFMALSSKEQLKILEDVGRDVSTTKTSLVFIDNIQTGKNYIQHSAPHVFTNIESGLKVFGFTAHVNSMINDSAGIVYNGSNVVVRHALAEWGKYVGPVTKAETDAGWVNTGTVGVVENQYYPISAEQSITTKGSSKLGYEVIIHSRDYGWKLPTYYNNSNYKKYFYSTTYAPAYDNNATATAMLQYPAYNPYTLSTTSPNGSLIYKNGSGVEGFDIVLGNNQTLHIPSSDTVKYNVYDRVFNDGKVSNGALFKAYPNLQMILSKNYIATSQIQKVMSNTVIQTPEGANVEARASDFKYASLAFYKYSDTKYALNNLQGEGVLLDKAPAETIVSNDIQTESYKITSILFRSTYTVSRKLGTDGWVDITEGSNPDALVNAGKGFELKIQVTYTNSNLTEYLSRYAAHSPQLGVGNSSISGVTQTQCNISSLTGHYGENSAKDLYTSSVPSEEGEKPNDVFGTNLFKDIYVVMNNNNKYVYSHSGIYGTTNVFDASTEYEYVDGSSTGKIIITYTMKLSPVNGYFGNTSNVEDSISGLATQNMKFYTDSAAAGTIGSLTIWTNPLVVTPFDYPNTMKDRYLADLKQIQYYIINPADNVDNIVQ